MVHEVCYDPMNVDLQTYKIYLNLFDTGSMEQWLKFLTNITRNGLMASWVKFNLMQLLLKGEALQHFNNNAQMRQMCITNYASTWSLHTSSPRMLFRCRNATCKRSISMV